MAELRATFHFRVRGLLIEAGLLGTSHELSADPYRIVLTLPSSELSKEEPGEEQLIRTGFPAEEPAPRTIGGFVTGGVRVVPSRDLARVELIRVEVFLPAEISAADFEDEERTDWTVFQDPAFDLLGEALTAAQIKAGHFLDWIRVAGNQHWLGLSGLEPEPIGIAELVDMDAFTRIPVTLSTTPTVLRQVAESQVLNAAALSGFAASAQAGRPSLAASLLADAAHYAWDAEPPDSDRAILIAAIACEVRVKDALRAGVEGVSAGLIDLLLDHPRDWSMAAAALWHKPLKVIFGHSLSDEESAVFQEIERLFARRNRIAHRGETTDNEAAMESVRAVSKAFKWLRGVSSSADDERS